jgi:hypothetical protein
MGTRFILSLTILLGLISPSISQTLLVEAESFSDPGGWKLDTQFIHEMGSPYLLAHGLGKPVADAKTTIEFPTTGSYTVWVRTKDWVARWKAPGQPGKFELHINGVPLKQQFGVKGENWFWQMGGTVQIDQKRNELTLHDMTGFDGRCDAIAFTLDPDWLPPQSTEILPSWRRQLSNISDKPIIKNGYDLVVIGGGYAGVAASLSAARMGCKVALVQNRGVLGGNGSSEVRVWAKGNIRRGPYPRIGEIVNEFSDQATKSPGTYQEFEDNKKEALVRAEKNIDLYLNHHAYQVELSSANSIKSILAFDTHTSELKQFSGTHFVDCTGHGTIGTLAGAKADITSTGRMGMSNMWRWEQSPQRSEFPDTPWALELSMKDFPYPRDFHGQWFWESGFDKDPLGDAEGIRDWNLRAVYGAFNAMKNKEGAAQHPTASLTWVAFIGGPRESRRLLGDVILTEADIVGKRDFPDGVVPSTWSIDLHYPKEQYAKKYPENPFISKAVHGKGVDRSYGYPVPYRCFYSANIDNLFMAGRCISVTHEALGTVRVMKTCGMMGEVVGKAASLCAVHQCSPREVYQKYLPELKNLLRLPGGSRRLSIGSKLTIPDVPIAEQPKPQVVNQGISPKRIAGTVIDDVSAIQKGIWTKGTGLNGFIGKHYLYASANTDASIRFPLKPEKSARFEIRLAYRHHENRTEKARIVIERGIDSKTLYLDLTKAPDLEHGFVSLGEFDLKKDQSTAVIMSHGDSIGHLCADAIQILSVK